jgi:hypothetical protein
MRILAAQKRAFGHTTEINVCDQAPALKCFLAKGAPQKPWI